MDDESEVRGKGALPLAGKITASIGTLLLAVGLVNVFSVSGKSLSEGTSYGFMNGLTLMFGFGLSILGGTIALIGLVLYLASRIRA